MTDFNDFGRGYCCYVISHRDAERLIQEAIGGDKVARKLVEAVIQFLKAHEAMPRDDATRCLMCSNTHFCEGGDTPYAFAIMVPITEDEMGQVSPICDRCAKARTGNQMFNDVVEALKQEFGEDNFQRAN